MSVKFLPFLTALALAGVCASSQAADLRTGEAVYQGICVACHADGRDGAPRFGDRKAWGPLIREGQAVLTAHAWVGVRKMPAKGGRDDLLLEEFARGAAYMARGAGATWQDPDAKLMTRLADEVRKREAALAKKAGAK